ncbi:MAG: JAB domain-containing protein [Caldilineaceae bacterium]
MSDQTSIIVRPDPDNTIHTGDGPLPKRMRPAEKVLDSLDACSDAELLAVLLWTGTRQQEIDAAYALLQLAKGDLLNLRRYSVTELRKLNLDDRTIAKIRALLEVENRLATPIYEEVKGVTNPTDAARFMTMRLRGQEQEQIIVMSLDAQLHIMSLDVVAIGAPDMAMVRMADAFGPAVRHYATQIIVFHNHPTGNPDPSPDDLTFTKELIATGKLLTIKVLDHVIIGQGRFTSIRERRLVKFD